MSDKIEITWRVADGYVGKDRPHTLKVDREEWEEMDEDARDRFVYDHAMQEISIDWEISA